MSVAKDAVTAAASDKTAKRPANFTVRHDMRQQPAENSTLVNQAMANAESTGLQTSLNQSRHAWTHSTFRRFMPGLRVGDKAHSHGHSPSGLSLAGVCTVHVGPHIYFDTKFSTIHTLSDPPSLVTADKEVKLEATFKREQDREQPLVYATQLQHHVVMEFKENPGVFWLFPEEASLEFTPASDHEPGKISASFYVPVSYQHSSTAGHEAETLPHPTTMTILKATPALREGLELAVKGPRTTSVRATRNPSNRQHTSSTYSEDPSEILGSGKSPIVHASSLAKRRMDTMLESQRPLKSKRTKENSEKSAGPSNKKTSGGGSVKRNDASSSSAGAAQQKRCGYCECTTTPMWRRGPHGPSTLCNACGVKWKHGKILQDPSDTHLALKSTSYTASGLASSIDSQRTPSSKSTKTSALNIQAHGPVDNKPKVKTVSKHSEQRPPSVHHEFPSNQHEVNGIRSTDAERIVPVKKRYSGKVAAGKPPGPRMVPVHELGDPNKTTSRGVSNSKQHGPGVHDVLFSNGRSKRKKNGIVHKNRSADPNSSPASSVSTQSEIRMDTDESFVSSAGADEGLSIYSQNLYTNNTATFPLHFPTISIGFGPNNAYYTYPNCAVVLFENHFQIKLVQAGERTEIDVWKEGIEATEFQVIDVGDGESMIIMKILLRQYLTRFDKELLNPDRNESLIVFRFRERLDGGGPSVKPLLEHWLAADIPVPPPPPSDST
ncbi:hypothetical protein EDD11_005293 [Mortierella claussenii]|nr:hypothetical protein EDD11_005293 [Mortierella claussenii]